MISPAKAFLTAFVTTFALALPGSAQDAFQHGWTLEGDGSHLNFITVKKGKVMEASSFATLDGSIDEDGNATFEVLLDSIDTKVDLRNVRMRFLMFETFSYPKATVTAKLTDEMLDGLIADQIKMIQLPFQLDLHGVTKDLTADVMVRLSGADHVSITSAKPIVLNVEDFNLLGGIEKLQDAAEVTIVPTTAVTFGLTFARNSATQPLVVANTVQPAQTAVEPAGNFDTAACQLRFETVSRSGSIYFSPNSADLAGESAPLLESVASIIEKCPGMRIQVAGHTDSRGSADYNMFLSKERAQSVVAYLESLGLPKNQMISRGFGETRPIATNATRVGRSKNRRIEFIILNNSNSG